eukprot:3615026-Prymnesium_polylepis.1
MRHACVSPAGQGIRVVGLSIPMGHCVLHAYRGMNFHILLLAHKSFTMQNTRGAAGRQRRHTHPNEGDIHRTFSVCEI